MGLGLLPVAGRLAGIALLLVAAAYSGQNSTQSYWREDDPKSAYSADPSDGMAAAKAFAAELQTNAQFIISSRDADNARYALISRPLNASLLSFMGLRAASLDQAGEARAIMASADTISRRDAFSQLWMIEQKSGSGDVRGAVNHYHALLTVHPAMQATLLPVLVSASAFPEVRTAIRPYLAPGTRWAAPFLDLASQRAEIAQYRDLIAPIAAKLRGDEFDASNARIVYRMLQSGLAGDAWKLFNLVAPDVDVDAFRTFAPGGANLEPKWQPLSWVLGQSDDISANVGANGAIGVTVAPTARGLIASRDMPVFPSSTYMLGHRSVYEPGSPRTSLRWRIYCVAMNEPQLIIDRFVPDTANSKLVQLSVAVPEDCNLVRFVLSALGPEGQSRSRINITDFTLKKHN